MTIISPSSSSFACYALSPCDRIKFAIPFATASVALILCLIVTFDCQSSIFVEGEWHGIFTHMPAATGEECVSYRRHPLANLPDDPQLVAAQIGSCVVLALGIPLWLCLAASPCWKRPNQVWPKIISISVALVIGNAQLFTVVKFIRYILMAYPTAKVYYEHRAIVIGSVLSWLATGVAISLCGVKPPLPLPRETPAPAVPPPLAKVASDDTQYTHGELLPVQESASEDSKEIHDVEEGMVQIHTLCSSEDDFRDGEDGGAIEMSLSQA